MKCPLCGASAPFDFVHCPHCGYTLPAVAEKPLPNWRQLPGFRGKNPLKVLIAMVIYLWILLAMLAVAFQPW